MKCICPYCNIEFEKANNYVNKAKSINAPLYCSKACSGLARRKEITQEQFKANKAEYDKKRRADKAEEIKKQKKEYYKTPSGRATQKRNRNQQKENHLQYCRTPEYREWKRQYDELYNAKLAFGEFAEAALILENICNIVDNREAVKLKGTYGKSTKRKRAWLKTKKSNLAQ